MTESDTLRIKVSFYVLGANRAQDILGFICDLTQKALNNSNEQLLILMEDEAHLEKLDALLWSANTTSFIPHERLDFTNNTTDTDNKESQASFNHQRLSNRAPVLLANYVPDLFHGLVLNTANKPVNEYINAAQNVTVSRILEIIAPDASSMQYGRDKYKRYQQLGYELTHFKV